MRNFFVLHLEYFRRLQGLLTRFTFTLSCESFIFMVFLFYFSADFFVIFITCLKLIKTVILNVIEGGVR